MNIKLTICNLCARVAMLLLVTVISIGGAWAQYSIDLSCATIKCDEGDFSKLLKGENKANKTREKSYTLLNRHDSYYYSLSPM